MERTSQITDLTNRFFKNRWLYHSVFWISYNTFWHVIYSDHFFSWKSFFITLIFGVCHISASYTNNYYLMPKYFATKRYAPYLFLLTLNILFFSLILGIALYYAFTAFAPKAIEALYNTHYIFGATIGSTSSTVALVMIIKMVKQKWQTEQVNQRLEKDQLQTELKFLKSQLNPHFLFNALNSIYFLIKKDPEAAADSLAKFSEMLRYQLYDCNDNRIALQQEVNFLKNFIQLSQLRKNRLQVKVDFDSSINGEQIAPLLLIPFVENAFKHVSAFKDQENWIEIKLQLQNQQLQLQVENSIENVLTTVTQQDSQGGIGLANVKRRLALTYPNAHHLNTQKDKHKFKVDLSIDL